MSAQTTQEIPFHNYIVSTNALKHNTESNSGFKKLPTTLKLTIMFSISEHNISFCDTAVIASRLYVENNKDLSVIPLQKNTSNIHGKYIAHIFSNPIYFVERKRFNDIRNIYLFIMNSMMPDFD